MDFKKHLERYLNQEEINRLIDSLDEPSKHALLLNTEKMSEETLLSFYPHIVKHPLVKNGYLYDKDEYQLGKSVFHELGAFYLQEPSAMLVSCLLDPKPNQIVLDLCAAPGGKTVQASYLMKDTGLILSNDLSYPRAKVIKENAERLGLGNLLIISNDFSTIYKKYLNTFDAIILDAPCSGSGMFRKHDLMKDDWSYNKVLKFASLQKELILYAYQMLKEGGKLIYSTCSFSYEEDEDVSHYLLENSDAIYEPFESNLYFYTSKDNLGIHLFPHLFPGEGHYICLFKKPGVLKDNKSKDNKKVSLFDNKVLHKYGEISYLSNNDFDVKGLNVIRFGVKLGEILKDDIKYDLHYARNIKQFPQELEISLDDTKKYIEGNSLDIIYPKGYVLLKYLGIPIDIAKSDGRIIKNRYPKYLRKRVA